MKIFKTISLVVAVYAIVVVVFELYLGRMQPQFDRTLVLTTSDSRGRLHDRVLTQISYQGQLYVAVNHWPRGWYKRLLENPLVSVTVGDLSGDYLAVPVQQAPEIAGLHQARPLSLGFRFLTGFPPRYFVKLEPR